MRNIRLYSNLPNTHDDFLIKMPPYKDMQVVKKLDEFDKLTEWGKSYEFAILSNSCRVIDTDDYTNLQQRFYIRGNVDRKIWEQIDLKALWFMSIGCFGGTNRGTIIYAYEKFKAKQ